MTRESQDHRRRLELADWYRDRLRPKIVAAAQSGRVSLGELVALDNLLEPLLTPEPRFTARTRASASRVA